MNGKERCMTNIILAVRYSNLTFRKKLIDLQNSLNCCDIFIRKTNTITGR